MNTVRQDAWSTEDDVILAEVTLRYIREGGTQLGAFEEVGEKIGRTAAACGFRWNSCVRKKYEKAIKNAKSQRQKRNFFKKQVPTMSFQVSTSDFSNHDERGDRFDDMTEMALSIEAVIQFLKQWENKVQEHNRQLNMLEKQLRDKELELQQIRDMNERLSRQVNQVSTDYRVVNDDYKTLIQIMDRARRLTYLNEEEAFTKNRLMMDTTTNVD